MKTYFRSNTTPTDQVRMELTGGVRSRLNPFAPVLIKGVVTDALRKKLSRFSDESAVCKAMFNIGITTLLTDHEAQTVNMDRLLLQAIDLRNSGHTDKVYAFEPSVIDFCYRNEMRGILNKLTWSDDSNERSSVTLILLKDKNNIARAINLLGLKGYIARAGLHAHPFHRSFEGIMSRHPEYFNNIDPWLLSTAHLQHCKNCLDIVPASVKGFKINDYLEGKV